MSIAEGIVLQIFLLDLFSVIGNLKKIMILEFVRFSFTEIFLKMIDH